MSATAEKNGNEKEWFMSKAPQFHMFFTVKILIFISSRTPNFRIASGHQKVVSIAIFCNLKGI